MGITVYSQKACAPCIKLKYWLDKHKIEYTETPLEEHIPLMQSLGFMSAPVVAIDGKYFNGADLSSVAEHIRDNGGI